MGLTLQDTGEATPSERESEAPPSDLPASPRRRRWLPDALIALTLGVVAFLLRLSVPPNGLFFDDAWQAFAASRGSFGQLLTVGQTQPAFGLGLMVWSRVFGATTLTMIEPAIIAGSLGPPALYLVLRRYHFARSVAAFLGSALAVCATHIIYSGRVKVYTFEVLTILVLVIVVPWLAGLHWRVRTAAAWFAASTLIATVSSFALLACVAAAIILVVHPRGDLRLRLAATALQAVGVVTVIVAVDHTHSDRLLTAYFVHADGFLRAQLNPFSFSRELFHHVTRITAVFPGGPAWLQGVLVLAVGVGIASLAVHGTRRGIAARLLAAMVVLAFVGAVARRVPFGPAPSGFRATLWLIPVIAFGLAAVLQRFRRAAVERGRSAGRVVDAALFRARRAAAVHCDRCPSALSTGLPRRDKASDFARGTDGRDPGDTAHDVLIRLQHHIHTRG